MTKNNWFEMELIKCENSLENQLTKCLRTVPHSDNELCVSAGNGRGLSVSMKNGRDVLVDSLFWRSFVSVWWRLGSRLWSCLLCYCALKIRLAISHSKPFESSNSWFFSLRDELDCWPIRWSDLKAYANLSFGADGLTIELFTGMRSQNRLLKKNRIFFFENYRWMGECTLH